MSQLNAYYKEKEQKYFSVPRTDILPLLPVKVERVQEIGCGHGSTIQWLRTIRDCKEVVGVELFPEAAAIARERVDIVIQGDIETIELPF